MIRELCRDIAPPMVMMINWQGRCDLQPGINPPKKSIAKSQTHPSSAFDTGCFFTNTLKDIYPFNFHDFKSRGRSPCFDKLGEVSLRFRDIWWNYRRWFWGNVTGMPNDGKEVAAERSSTMLINQGLPKFELRHIFNHWSEIELALKSPHDLKKRPPLKWRKRVPSSILDVNLTDISGRKVPLEPT